MPIFFSAQVARLFDFRARHQRKNLAIRGADNERQIRPFQIGLDFVETVHKREGDLARENRLNAPGAGRNVNQFHLESVLGEQPFLLGHEHAALRPGDRRPVDPDAILRRRDRYQRRDEKHG